MPRRMSDGAKRAAAHHDCQDVTVKMTSGARILVAVVVAHPALRGLRIFVPSLGHQIEDLVGAVEHVDAARVARVGAEYPAVRILEEKTQPLTMLHSGRQDDEDLERLPALDLSGREGRAKVVVELVAARRGALGLHALALLERRLLLAWHARDHDERHV